MTAVMTGLSPRHHRRIAKRKNLAGPSGRFAMYSPSTPGAVISAKADHRLDDKESVTSTP